MTSAVFLVGAGKTGKTALLNAMRRHLTENPPVFTWSLHESIARDFFKSRGMPTEKDMLVMPLKERVAFQLDLMDAYMAKVKELFEKRESDVMFFDRSIFCHGSYVLVNAFSQGEEQLTDKDADVVLNRILTAAAWFEDTDSCFFKLPALTDWMSKAADDNFRWAPKIKNLVVDGFQNSLVTQAKPATYFEIDPEGNLLVEHRLREWIDHLSNYFVMPRMNT